jgi:hypothetical protein
VTGPDMKTGSDPIPARFVAGRAFKGVVLLSALLGLGLLCSAMSLPRRAASSPSTMPAGQGQSMMTRMQQPVRQ